MAEDEVVLKIDDLKLHHDIASNDNNNVFEENTEKSWLGYGAISCLNTANHNIGENKVDEKVPNVPKDKSQVEYMTKNFPAEKKHGILDEKISEYDESNVQDINSSVFNIVTNIINDLLGSVENSQYFLNQTGLVYDKRMCKYHFIRLHPERPDRIRHIYQKLNDDGLVNRCKLIEPRLATTEELLTIHSIEHIALINSLKDKEFNELEKLAQNYDSIYFHPAVTESALLAAGCTLALMEEVILGKVLNGAAVVRPPGHHALNHCSMGFCHFNNVAIAAMIAVEKYKLNRVLIVDWDVHYGNGTHKMFERDPRVLFFSMHRYDHGFFWPSLKEANYDSVGIDKGEGYNIHVAWNRGKMGNAEYLLAFEQILIPVAEEYNPELVIVSSGFDSGAGDPLGGCMLTPSGYAHMTRKLMNLASGKLILVLEGGYNLNTISDSMAACVLTLLNDSLPELKLEEPLMEGVQSVKDTFFTIQKYWPSLLNESFPKNGGCVENTVLSDDVYTPDLIL